MKRRGFLGLFGGAVVAGPGMAKQAVASVGLDAMALSAMPMDMGPTAGYQAGSIGISENYDHTQWLRDRINDVVGMSDAERRERIAQQHVPMLDPDLAVNRSFSLAFKVQEQKRRNFELYNSREHKHLLRELAEHIKRQALQ